MEIFVHMPYAFNAFMDVCVHLRFAHLKLARWQTSWSRGERVAWWVRDNLNNWIFREHANHIELIRMDALIPWVCITTKFWQPPIKIIATIFLCIPNIPSLSQSHSIPETPLHLKENSVVGSKEECYEFCFSVIVPQGKFLSPFPYA